MWIGIMYHLIIEDIRALFKSPSKKLRGKSFTEHPAHNLGQEREL